MSETILWHVIDEPAAVHLTSRTDGTVRLHIEVDGLGHVLRLTPGEVQRLRYVLAGLDRVTA